MAKDEKVSLDEVWIRSKSGRMWAEILNMQGRGEALKRVNTPLPEQIPPFDYMAYDKKNG
jgi:hypothetical protein